MNVTRSNEVKIVSVFVMIIILSGCASTPRFTSKDSGTRIEKKETKRNNKEEKPHIIDVSPDADILETTVGVASYYGEKFNGRGTASGEIYNIHEFTAAHKTYPFNTIVRVTNMLNDRSVVVRINDRKPDLQGRIIDLSYAAAKELDMVIKGITKVKVEVISWGKE